MMKDRTRLLAIVAVLAVCAVALVAAFAQCGRQPPPAVETPGMTAVPTTPGATAPTPLPDTTTTEPTAPAGLPTPTPTPTEGEMALTELQRRHNDWCDPSCQATREAVDSYAEYGTPREVTRPEWRTLFPETKFYILPWVDFYMGDSQQRNDLLALHQEQWYDAETFDRLLAANGITTITDENRELVARAFALMNLRDYLEEEIVLTDLEEGDWPLSSFYSYNYMLTTWTKIQGINIQWYFWFYEDRLISAQGVVAGYHGGDYMDVPFERLPLPSDGSLSYWW